MLRLLIQLSTQVGNLRRSRTGIVRSKKRDSDGELVGKYNSHPILGQTVYNVEFVDGIVEELTI